MKISASLRLVLLLALLHGAALLGAFFLPNWLGMPLMLLLLGSFFFVARKDAWRLAPDSITHLLHEEEDIYTLEARNGIKQQAKLQPGCFVSPWLTILRFKDESGRSQNVLLMPDAVDGEEFRRLRSVILRS